MFHNPLQMWNCCWNFMKRCSVLVCLNEKLVTFMCLHWFTRFSSPRLCTLEHPLQFIKHVTDPIPNVVLLYFLFPFNFGKGTLYFITEYYRNLVMWFALCKNQYVNKKKSKHLFLYHAELFCCFWDSCSFLTTFR